MKKLAKRTRCMFRAAVVAVPIGFAAASGAAAEPVIDARAESALRGMSTLLQSARGFNFSAQITWDAPTTKGILLQVTHDVEAAVGEARHFHVEIAGDIAEVGFWYDGAHLTVLDRAAGEFARLTAPDQIDQALDELIDEYQRSFPLADFLYSDPYAVLTENVREGHYVGRHFVDGVPTHHLVFLQDDIDWQIWIEDSDTPLPRKLAIAYRMRPGIPRYLAVFEDWSLSPDLAAQDLEFAAPGEAREVDFVPLP